MNEGAKIEGGDASLPPWCFVGRFGFGSLSFFQCMYDAERPLSSRGGWITRPVEGLVPKCDYYCHSTRLNQDVNVL